MTSLQRECLEVKSREEQSDLQHKVREELSAWLSGHHWDWFVTGTFRFKASVPAAWRAWQRWLRTMPAAAWYAALELTQRDGKEVPHIHALVNCNVYTPMDDLRHLVYNPQGCTEWERWFKSYGRCKIERYDPARGAARYVSKYVTKTVYDQGDYMVGGQWQGIRTGNAGERPVTEALPLASSLRSL